MQVRARRPTPLERAIGVIYRPETELQSHYFQAAPGVARTVGSKSMDYSNNVPEGRPCRVEEPAT